MGAVCGLVFANFGAAYGTSKSGVGIISVAVLKPDLLFKSIIPAVMASVLGLYGMIMGILIVTQGKFVRHAPRSRPSPPRLCQSNLLPTTRRPSTTLPNGK